MTKFHKVAKVGIITAAALMPMLALAQLTPTVLTPPTSPFAGSAVTLDTVQAVIETIARFLIIISVVIAVIFIVWGGIMYMTAGDDASKASAAKTRIVNGMIGALVVLAVGVILQTLAGLVNWTAFFGL